MSEIKKYLACEGRVNIICAETTDLVEEARKVHDLSPVATATLGRVLTMAAIMSTRIKGEDTITLQIKGNGPIGNVVSVFDGNQNIKGYVGDPLVDLPIREDGKLDVGGAVGKEGFLYVIRDMGLKEPYIGVTPLISGEIAEDFTKYFAESEQTPSAVALGVLVDKDGVKKAGGYLLTLMPDATEEDIKQVEEALKNLEPVTTMLDKNMSLQEIAEKATNDDNLMVMVGEIKPKYHCNCSKEKFLNNLKKLGEDDINHLFEEQETIETVCQFCNKKYEFKIEDIKK
ncbi:MAG: Hsp33 family molecular chaperone HslO [Clostridia bacterium]|nr:Hsp33 family molecular chaperone HslO [Clostridia bacterium]